MKELNLDSEQTKQAKIDLAELETTLKSAQNSTKEFGRVFSSTLSSAIIKGKSFEDTLRSIGSRIADMALKKAFSPLDSILNSAIGSIGSVPTSATPYAKGGAFSFGRQSLVNSPTLFSSSGGLGVMGEAGPEAILPLSKGPGGRLGVATSGGTNPINVTFNVQTQNAATFEKSEAQLTALLARTVKRGERSL